MRSNTFSSLIPERLLSSTDDVYKLLKAYYKYRDQNDVVLDIAKAKSDLSVAIESFIGEVEYDLGAGFVSDFLVSRETIWRRINDLYVSKGSDFSLQFVFLTVFGVPIDVFYPGVLSFKASDSAWRELRSVLLYVNNRQFFVSNFKVGVQAVLTNNAGQRYSVDLISARYAPSESYVEVFFSVDRQISSGLDYITLEIADQTYSIQKTLTNIDIINPGFSFREGSTYHVVDEYSSGITLRVSEVNSAGSIVSLDIVSLGSGYRSPAFVRLYPEDWESTVVAFGFTFDNITERLSEFTDTFRLYGDNRYAVYSYFADDYTFTYTLLREASDTYAGADTNLSLIDKRPRFVDLVGRLSDTIRISCNNEVFREKTDADLTNPIKYFHRLDGGAATLKLSSKTIQERQGYWNNSFAHPSISAHLSDVEEYNPYVYTIGSELNREDYEATIRKTVHPFGKVLRSSVYNDNIHAFSSTCYGFEIVGIEPGPKQYFDSVDVSSQMNMFADDLYAIEYFAEDYNYDRVLVRTS